MLLLLPLLLSCAHRAEPAPVAVEPPAPPPEMAIPAGRTFQLTLQDTTQATAVELVCPSGYRKRSSFALGVATFQGVPDEACKLYFKGGAPAAFGPVPADAAALYCRIVGTTGVCAASVAELKDAIPPGLP